MAKRGDGFGFVLLAVVFVVGGLGAYVVNNQVYPELEVKNRTGDAEANNGSDGGENNRGDLSYVVIHVDKGVMAMLTDPRGDRVGWSATGEEAREIDNSTMGVELPLVSAAGTTSGESFYEILVNKPVSGVYQLELAIETAGKYELDVYVYNAEAEVETFKLSEKVGAGEKVGYQFRFDKNLEQNFASLERLN